MTIPSLDLVQGSGLSRLATLRLRNYKTETIPAALQQSYEQEDWVLDKKLKRSVRMKYPKSHDVMFEDKIWAVLARLGFSQLNAGRNLRLRYGDVTNEQKQVDVFAADDNVVLVIECKSSNAAKPVSSGFSKEVLEIRGYRDGLMKHLRLVYPKHKIKFILATNNYVLSDDTHDRLRSADIGHLDEDNIDYYLELAAHLGPVARYQFLGSVLDGVKIHGLESTIPAIRGKMGGLTYYQFAIEPARLLQIAYVLHKTRGSAGSIETYQRLIKRARLKKVNEFVESGGFFPNSIVISIDAGARKMAFDLAGKHDASSTIGTLHLPQNYKSAYVIDGQHRLYGYAGTSRDSSELIPVVAFEGLSPTAQVELFMEINENQQAVPKNLRDSLNSELLWESNNLQDRAKALKLRVAQALGDGKGAALKGRVIIGDDKPNNLRCVTIDAISQGVDRGGFIGTFSKTSMRTAGSFYRGANAPTQKPLVAYLDKVLWYFRDALPEQWDAGRGEGGFVFINNGVTALLRLAGAVVEHLREKGLVNPLVDDAETVYLRTEEYLGVVASFLQSRTPDEGKELKRAYGSAGSSKYLHKLQAAVHDRYPEFNPDGLAEYVANQAKQFNDESYSLIRDIESHLKVDIRDRLERAYSANWFKLGLPKVVYQKATALAADKNYGVTEEDEVEPWDCLNLSDYHQIMTQSQVFWDQILDDSYAAPSDRKKGISYKQKCRWMNELIRIRNSNAHSYSVTEDEFNFLSSLHGWLGLAV